MDASTASKIDRNIRRSASAIFAGACAFAAYSYLSADFAQPQLGADTGGALALAYLLCSRTMRAIAPERQSFAQPVFALAELSPVEIDEESSELLLTETDRVPAEQGSDVLLLDDVLDAIGNDSRVVRLFDPAAMPTPGQLRSRIDRHIEKGAPTSRGAPDASHELHEALAKLRANLR
jgi:hypothetical protein